MNDKKAATIEALLAKAESTTSPEEAEAFTAKAEELMIRYGIEQAMIDQRRAAAGGVADKIITKAMAPRPGNYGMAMVSGGWRVARAMSGEAVQGYCANVKGGHQLVLVGYESDVEQADRLITSLHLQAIVARDAWWMEYSQTYQATLLSKGEVYTQKRTFVDNFYKGAAARLFEERQVAVKEAKQTSAGTDIVLADRATAVQHYMTDMLGMKLRGRATSRSHGRAGASAGFEAGQKANVGTTGIGGSRRAVG